MKLLLSVALSLGILLSGTSQVLAAPENAADTNPQIVSYYPEGVHGIVGESEYHTGMDIVMRAGNSGVFQQWFYGNEYPTSNGQGTPKTIGHHTVFQPTKDETCPEGWYELFNINTSSNNFWGYHFETGADYCVKTNDFKEDKK